MTSIYIHIPFCKKICNYCDFCKFYYNKDLIDKYLNSLEKEVKSRYKKELVDTIYIGGGTPSCLDFEQQGKLFTIINELKKNSNIEFTFECNIEDINDKLLKYLKNKGVTRLSIGLQTFNKRLLKILGRNYTDNAIEKIESANRYFSVNIDLIYAIPGQTLKDLEKDLDTLINLDVDHISAYSLIIEPHTKLYIDNISNISDELDYQMYQLINDKLKEYNHYEISNYAKKGKESKHNLTYWYNDSYCGFGLSSSGYIDDIRYDNTKSINKYLIDQYILNEHRLSINEQIENEFILGLRKIEGINKKKFYDKYHLNINKIPVVKKLLEDKKLVESDDNIYIPCHLIYTSNDILVKFLGINYKNIV